MFTLRIFHGNTVFMIGPEANHFMTVSHADNFSWREGHMGDLTPLLGDGLLTIDGDFHRSSRKAMFRAFQRERIAASTWTYDDRRRSTRASRQWSDRQRVDIYAWTARASRCAIAMRALFGIDPHGSVARELDVGTLCRGGPRLLL